MRISNFALFLGMVVLVIVAIIRMPIGNNVPVGQEVQEPQEVVAVEIDRLTVAETLGLVYARYQHKTPYNLYRYANPNAKESIYKILADPEQEEFHGHAWLILGYIGDQSDVQQLEKHMHKFSGPLMGNQRGNLIDMFKCLGFMCGRNVKQACTLVGKMQKLEYWESVNLQWESKSNPNFLPNKYYSIQWLMYGYAFSRKPDLEERVQGVLAGIEDPAISERMEGILDLGHLKSSANNSLKHEDDLITPEELKTLVSLFNGDLEHPEPTWYVTGIGEEPEQQAAAVANRNEDVENQEPVEERRRFVVRTRPEQKLVEPPPDASNKEIADALEAIGAETSLDENGDVEYLTVSGPRISDEAVRLAARLPELRDLSIGNGPLTNKCLTVLLSLPSLRRLSIYRCGDITDVGLPPLVALPDLESLYLAHLPNVTDAGLGHVRGLTKLKMIDLNNLPITDAGLVHLKDLQDLERLSVYDARITGEGLKHLTGLTNLRILLLRGVPLTDAGLAHLEEMDGLEEIWMGPTTSDSYQSKVTQAGVDRLRRALPECKIDYVPPSE